MQVNTARRNIRLPMTPLIDVVFILLLFFMLSTSFTRMQQLNVDQATAAETATAEDKDIVFLLVLPQGGVRYDSGIFNIETPAWEQRVAQWAKQQSPIIIAGQKATPVQALIHVIDQLKLSGLSTIQLAESL